jgi:beta-phosphoglucomutase-like phosphatase (HAD superfamily)
VFLTAAKSISVSPVHCVVFEDAPAGVLAAKAARMTCVAVPDAEDERHRFIGIADLVLPSLEAFTMDALVALDTMVTTAR